MVADERTALSIGLTLGQRGDVPAGRELLRRLGPVELDSCSLSDFSQTTVCIALASSPAILPRLLRRPGALSICLAALLIDVLASLALGSRQVGLLVSIEAPFSYGRTLADHIAINAQRVRRMAIGLLAGAAPEAAGAQIQGVTCSPLPGPGILGISTGAVDHSLPVIFARRCGLALAIYLAFCG